MKTRCTILGAIAASAVCAAASADIAIVDGLGGPVDVRSRFVAGSFGSGSPDFSDGALSTIHSELQASGIVTDGMISNLLIETEDAGVAWVVLVDDQNQAGEFEGVDSVLGMTTTAPGSASPFVNDEATDILVRQDLGNGGFFATGIFSWDSRHEGDGFAWGGLANGDFVSVNFSDQGATGIDGPSDFQFLSWNGESWDVAATADFSDSGSFAYTLTVVPSPGAVALLGIAGALARGNRRRA